jgi:hypothetical protein
MEPMRPLLAYSRCASWISSRLKVALIGTEILPSLSHSNRCSRSAAKFFELRFTPKKVVRFPDQKSRFFEKILRADGITGPLRSFGPRWQVHVVSHQHPSFLQDRVRLVEALESKWIEDCVDTGFLRDSDPLLIRIIERNSSKLTQFVVFGR